MTLLPGATVGRYQILAPLGQGGMATVYKAYQPSLDREVALKVLRPGYAQDKEFRERFEREARAVAKLRHPNIVQVFDFETAEGQYVLAMEFLEGGTLKDRLVQLAKERRGLDPPDAVRIVGEVAAALTYAHQRGVVHRDIKPSNVMLTSDGRAVVTDFGIARIITATSHTQTGVGIGTPEYMAPEQGQGGAIDHRADIYSLGAMAYEMLTGRVPFIADTPLAIVLAHMKDPLPLPSTVNPTIGPSLEKALLKALAKDREQRFDSATAFADALRDGLATPVAGSRTLGRPGPLGRRIAALGIAAALLAVGGGVFVATSRPTAETAAPREALPSVPGSAAASTPTSTLEQPPSLAATSAPPRGAPTVALESTTVSASREQIVVVITGYPGGTKATFVSARHLASGFTQPVGVEFSTSGDPFRARVPASDIPLGQYVFTWNVGGTEYSLNCTIVL